jgi:hypothetical protein
VKMSASYKRKRTFNRWWNKRHHNHSAHLWLCNHARRTARDLFLPPVATDTVYYITKRYFKSEYKLLTKTDAWTLWRLIHPVQNRRTERMLQLAEQLRETKNQIKQESKK